MVPVLTRPVVTPAADAPPRGIRRLRAGVVVWVVLVMAIPRAEAAPATAKQEVAAALSRKDVRAALGWFRPHERELEERQLELARIPAPPFGERARGEWLRKQFSDLGLHDVHVDAVGNVIGVRPGTEAGAKFIAITAHIDTVFPEGTPLDVHREGRRLAGPGISDNSAGVVGLLALAGALHAARIATDAPVVFVGNVGEEGEGDLRGMRFFFGDPKWKGKIAYTIVLDGAATDTIVTQALGSRRFEVAIHAPGGHSWSDFGEPNPIVLLARAIEIFSRTSVPSDPKTTYNIGVISGGTSVNSIPESATMRVDLRSASTAEIDRLEKSLRDAVKEAVAADAAGRGNPGVSCDVKAIGSRPAAELNGDAHILKVIVAVDEALGNTARLHRASTDANVPLSLGLEAVSLGAGGSGGGAHTVHEWYDPSGRDLGLKRLLLAVVTLAGSE